MIDIWTPQNLDELEALAAAATQGESQLGRTVTETHEEAAKYVEDAIKFSDETRLWMVFVDEGGNPDMRITALTGNGPNSENNALYYAAVSPQNILALIKEVRRLRQYEPSDEFDDEQLARAWV
jgi:hypothetical protein